jgi:hypothetical protein
LDDRFLASRRKSKAKTRSQVKLSGKTELKTMPSSQIAKLKSKEQARKEQEKRTLKTV